MQPQARKNHIHVLPVEKYTNNPFDQIIGQSQKMQNVFNIVKRIAHINTTVLITGESGSGKEMIAKAIHQMSSLREHPFVAINCASIPESLLESELFGHTKGAFTGAHQERDGLFHEANGGILFLDEIGDMPMSLQAKLLRILQDKKVKRIGENTYKQVNVRIIAATHCDLKNAIKKNLFREDLFYRLNVISIAVPALRERPEDIMPLAEFFLQKYSLLHHTHTKSFSKAATTALLRKKWHGNIRELENTVERAAVLCTSTEVQENDLFLDEVEIDDEFQKPKDSNYLSLNEVVMRYITFVLSKTGGKKEKAAQILKIDRTTLHRKIVEFGIMQQNDGDHYNFCELMSKPQNEQHTPC